jgi:hypothetical protein
MVPTTSRQQAKPTRWAPRLLSVPCLINHKGFCVCPAPRCTPNDDEVVASLALLFTAALIRLGWARQPIDRSIGFDTARASIQRADPLHPAATFQAHPPCHPIAGRPRQRPPRRRQGGVRLDSVVVRVGLGLDATPQQIDRTPLACFFPMHSNHRLRTTCPHPCPPTPSGSGRRDSPRQGTAQPGRLGLWTDGIGRRRRGRQRRRGVGRSTAALAARSGGSSSSRMG